MVVSERVFALATDGDHLWVGGKARIITKFGVQKKISFSKTECCPEVRYFLSTRLISHIVFISLHSTLSVRRGLSLLKSDPMEKKGFNMDSTEAKNPNSKVRITRKAFRSDNTSWLMWMY